MGQWAQVTKPARQSTFVSGNVKIDALRPPAGTFRARYLHDPDHAGFLEVGDDLSASTPVYRLRLPRQFVSVDTGTSGIRDDLVDLLDAGLVLIVSDALFVLGSLRLVPTDDLRVRLHADYDAMADMFMVAPPTFDALMASIASLEAKLNS